MHRGHVGQSLLWGIDWWWWCSGITKADKFVKDMHRYPWYMIPEQWTAIGSLIQLVKRNKRKKQTNNCRLKCLVAMQYSMVL